MKPPSLRALSTAALLAVFISLRAGNAGPETVSASVNATNATWSEALDVPLTFPGETVVYLAPPEHGWIQSASLEFDVVWPDSAPTNTQVLVFVKDWDYFWYQNLVPGYLEPGTTNHVNVSLLPDNDSWQPRGHHGRWHLRALMDPACVGIKLFNTAPFQGSCRLGSLCAPAREDRGPPTIRNVKANRTSLRCYEKFELVFDVTDRYPDPFDAEQVRVTAEIEPPDGKPCTVDGFYLRDFYRDAALGGDRLIAEGPPRWCVRFAPTREGRHVYTLHVKDTRGEAHWGPASFEAAPPEQPGFVRISNKDPRYFEFDDGTYYFPIGHNIRSPFDTRMDGQFPWTYRWPEGPTVYRHYFKAMGKHGENISEVWMAPWSLGLEWSPEHPGYHGVGQFNMMNAWELDYVIEAAESYGIYVNLVIHNHGKFTTVLDHEWETNPFSTENGGYLEKPEDYFTDPRAQAAFLKLMRYVIARWGYSTHIFAWQLWSELDLTGSKEGYFKHHQQDAVVEWHRTMGRRLKGMDPNAHLVSTHVSGDYTKQNKEIISLPEMDLCPIDAYHFSTDPLHIVELMRKTAEFNNPIGKPVLITEFGGSHMAQGLRHLSDTLHAALWASPAVPLGGAPMFWWWQVVDEENLYPGFGALERFVRGVDRRDPSMTMQSPSLLSGGGTADGVAVQCMHNRREAIGWIYRTSSFSDIDPGATPPDDVLTMQLTNMQNGPYAVEFWDTILGTPVRKMRSVCREETLRVEVPPFSRDIAFKLQRDPAGRH